MLRLLALALAFPILAHAQSAALLPCLGEEFEDVNAVLDAGPFEVWGEQAGFERESAPAVTRCEVPDAASPLFYDLEDGTVLLDAAVVRDGEPVPYAVVVAAARDEAGEPARVAAVGVADGEGMLQMTLPAARHALRLSVHGEGTEPPSVGARVDPEMEHAAQENPVFVAQEGAMNNVISSLTSGPDASGTDGIRGIAVLTFAKKREDTHRMADANRAFAHFGRRRTKK